MLHLLDYTTRKTEDAAGINTSKLTAKRDFIALNTEVEKLDFNKLLNFPTGSNKLNNSNNSNWNDLDTDKLKNISADLKNQVTYLLKKLLKIYVQQTKYQTK